MEEVVVLERLVLETEDCVVLYEEVVGVVVLLSFSVVEEVEEEALVFPEDTPEEVEAELVDIPSVWIILLVCEVESIFGCVTNTLLVLLEIYVLAVSDAAWRRYCHERTTWTHRSTRSVAERI